MTPDQNTNKMNPMRDIKIAKVTLNIGAGKSTERLEKGIKLFKMITDKTPVKTITNKRIAGWGLRPGLPIGCKVTVRGPDAYKLTERLLYALDKKLKSSQLDNAGNLSFGIPEYIEIQGVKYDPAIGSLGLEACITLTRPGFRVKRRKLQQRKVGKRHIIKREDAREFMKTRFNVIFDEE